MPSINQYPQPVFTISLCQDEITVLRRDGGNEGDRFLAGRIKPMTYADAVKLEEQIVCHIEKLHPGFYSDIKVRDSIRVR